MIKLDDVKQQMKTSLNESIIPKDHKGAFLTVYDGKQLVSAVAVNLNGHWELSGEIGLHPVGKKEVEGQVKIRATW
jgi:hypothetical protein